MRTISLIDQLRASRAMYDAALEDLEQLSDNDLGRLLAESASASTVARVLGVASASTVARVLGVASDSTVERVLGFASASTVARLNGVSALQVPIVDDLDAKVLASVEASGLNMDRWHCGTTHCRGGWAVTLAGDAGLALEREIGSEAAARLIYEASTGRPAPDFYASNGEALADIKACAGAA